jgi:hypothetical protein
MNLNEIYLNHSIQDPLLGFIFFLHRARIYKNNGTCFMNFGQVFKLIWILEVLNRFELTWKLKRDLKSNPAHWAQFGQAAQCHREAGLLRLTDALPPMRSSWRGSTGQLKPVGQGPNGGGTTERHDEERRWG